MNATDLIHDRNAVRRDFKAVISRPLPATARLEAWSPREALHHVLLVNQNSQSLLLRLHAKAKDLVTGPVANWPVNPELLDFPSATAFSIEAFPGTEPQQALSLSALEELEAAEEAGFGQLLELASQYQLAGLSFPHPLAGRMNFYEWLVFGVVHERLHLRRLMQDLS